MAAKTLSGTKAARGSQTNKTDPMKGNHGSNKTEVGDDDDYDDNFHDGMKNMTLNDPNDIVLDVENPWMNLPAFFTQKVEKEIAQVATTQQVTKNYSFTKFKVYFKVEDPNDIYSKNIYSASIQGSGKSIHLVAPMVPSNIKEVTQSFITDSKPPTRNEKLIAGIKGKKAKSKPPSQAEMKACAEAIPRIKKAAKKKRTFRLTFKDKSMCVHNAFSNEGAEENQLVIYKKTNYHPVKDRKGNPIQDRNKNEVKAFSYWGYVEVGINGTEIVLGEDTVSDATQSDDEEFQDFLGII